MLFCNASEFASCRVPLAIVVVPPKMFAPPSTTVPGVDARLLIVKLFAPEFPAVWMMPLTVRVWPLAASISPVPGVLPVSAPMPTPRVALNVGLLALPNKSPPLRTMLLTVVEAGAVPRLASADMLRVPALIVVLPA